MPQRTRKTATKSPSPVRRGSKSREGTRLFQVPKDSGDDTRKRKLGELIALAIKRDIADLGWPVGLVFGNQVELMARYKVSRSTLREAVRQIERHGVARMRRGVNGGLVVQQPARNSAVFAVASYLELAAVSLPELFEAREVVEGLMISLICERSTDAETRRLRGMLDELLSNTADDIELEATRHLELRTAILALSRNPALSLLLEALYRVTSDMLTVAGDDPRLPMLVKRSRKEKQDLVEALVAGDEIEARLALRSALDHSRDEAALHLQKFKLKFETANSLSLSVRRKVSDAAGPMPKLGHRVSLQIANDIASAEHRPGDRLGSEPEMRVRYGVSRAVLREAVRTLELHSIVHVRRGLGGGLVVGEPDPTYTVELTSIYFQFARLKPRHFYELWRALQISAAQFAARRIDEAGRAELQAVIAQQDKVKRKDMLTVHGRLHEVLSALSGNRVLALFTRIMAEIAAWYPTEVPPKAVWEVFVKSHAELVRAIGAGDVALARRLMTRHLKLVDAWYGESQRADWLQSLEQAEVAVTPAATAARRKPAAKSARKTRKDSR